MAEPLSVSLWIQKTLSILIQTIEKNRSGYSEEDAKYALADLLIKNLIGDHTSQDWLENLAQNPPHKEVINILGLDDSYLPGLAAAFRSRYSKEEYKRLAEDSQEYAADVSEIFKILGIEMPLVAPDNLRRFFVEAYYRLRPPSAWDDSPPSS